MKEFVVPGGPAPLKPGALADSQEAAINAAIKKGCTGCMVVAALIFILIRVGQQQPNYQEGLADGRAAAQQVIQRAGPPRAPEEVDHLINDLVEERRKQIYSKGNEYGDGYVEGLRSGMKAGIRNKEER